MLSERFYAVEGVESGVAILLDDDQRRVTVPAERLPARIKRGTVLRVPTDRNGTPDWGLARIDEKEGERRAGEAGEGGQEGQMGQQGRA